MTTEEEYQRYLNSYPRKDGPIYVSTGGDTGVLNPVYMEFLNGGSITIPAKYGGYVIASGCGSGKTTIIKRIIKENRYQGILYAAATIKECNEMYQYCKSIYAEEGILDRLNDDVIVLHSDYRSEGVDNNLWRNNTSEILNKCIIICTHHKLLNQYPEILIGYRRRILDINAIDDISRSMMRVPPPDKDGNIYLNDPRQFILIDEMPTCSMMRIKVSKGLIKLLGNRSSHTEVGYDGKLYVVPDDPVRYNSNRYDVLLKMYETDVPDDLKPIKVTDELSRLKCRIILSIISRNYDYLANKLDSSVKDVELVYNISTLVSKTSNNVEMCTRILLFDGTGDLTFSKSNGFKLLTFNNKYSSPIEIERIEYDLNRYIKPKKCDKSDIMNKVRCNVDKLIEIINSSDNGTLVITWKNFKTDDSSSDDESYSITNEVLNTNFPLDEYYEKMIYAAGVTKPFKVIHYQSGLDKATNEFREYDQVVFLGEFHVPDYVVNQFNTDYSCNTTPENYLTYQLVQAVCRTRIRMHKGLPVKIYFTSDWPVKSINNLMSYISSDSIVYKDSSLSHVSNKWKDKCRILMDYSQEFNDLVVYKKNGIVEFTLDEIYNLMPTPNKKVESYYSMIGYFKRKLGIEIIINSRNKNRSLLVNRSYI